MQIAVRLLGGETLAVDCEAGASVAQLKRALDAKRPGLSRCRLNLRGAFLRDADVVDSLRLQPGEFLVAFETRKKKAVAAQTAQPAVVQAAATPQANATPAASPQRTASPEQPELPPPPPPALASPGKRDTLLPGYLSRPNPSPVKARLLAPSPVAPALLEDATAAAVPAGGGAGAAAPLQEQLLAAESQPAAKRAKRSLLDLAAVRYGGGGGSRAIGAPTGRSAAAVPAATVPAVAGSSGQVAAAQPSAALAAAEAPHAQHQHQQQGQLLSELRSDLVQAARAAGQQAQELQSPPPPLQPVQHGAGSDAPVPAATPLAAAKTRRGPTRGAGSKRKQPAVSPPQLPVAHTAEGTPDVGSSLLILSEAGLDAAAAALPLPPLALQLEAGFSVLAQLHAFLTRTHIQTTWKNVQEAVGGMGLRQPLELPHCRAMAAVCPELVTVQEHHRVAPRSHREPWRQTQVTSPQKVRAAVAAAAAAEAAASGGGDPLPNPMHLPHGDGAGTVFGAAAVPASSASHAAAGAAAGEAGAGRAAGAAVAAAAEEGDTQVIDVVDPGRGFPSSPIPQAFLAQLRAAAAAAPPGGSGRAAAVGGSQGGAATAGPEAKDWEAEEADDVVEEAEEEATEDGVGRSGGGAGGDSGAARRPAPFRINKLVRQRWCFRRALVRALLLLQREHVGGAAAAHLRQAAAAVAPTGKKGKQRSGASQAGQQPAWHPTFDPAAVTAAQLQAAGEQLAAPARAAAAATERETAAADALAAARRLMSGGGSGGPAQGAANHGGAASAQQLHQQRGAARPPQLLKQHPACTDTSLLGTREFLAHLQQLPWYCGQVVHTEDLPARQARHARLAAPLAPAVAAALQLRGVRQLFLHQAEAVGHLLQGRHTVVATSTASGKSLCYLVPILQALAQDPSSCALLMFPTKALAQDQLRALRELVAAAFGSGEAPPPAVHIYDGDTPVGERDGIREQAQLLITNPDMLHMSILPVHQQFSRLLANLKYVVVDEGHAYKGVFGCHAALVLRRLRRLCARVYHSQPTFAVTTATVANPAEHACELLGVPEVQGATSGGSCQVVTQDGSPHGPKAFVMWNPPLLQGGFQARMSATEGRARGSEKRRQEQAAQRRRVQEGSQERHGGPAGGAGSGSADVASEAERLAAKKVARRQQQLVASSQQPNLGEQQPGGGTKQQHAGPTHVVQQQQQREQREQQGKDSTRRLSRALQREVAEAAAAIASVGGSISSGRLLQPAMHQPGSCAPLRPVIRRRAVGAASAVQEMAGNGTAAAAAAAADKEAEERRRQLPGVEQWREAVAALEAEQGVAGGGAAGGGSCQGCDGEDAGEEGEEARRSSPIVELSLLLAECVQHGLRTIAFCKSRKLCELVTAYVRETLKATAPHLAGTIAVYRAGYSPSERREIERALLHGDLRAVAATNALELGVDVGSLDCTLHLGFPGSVASLWQQAGRAGRREQPSLGIYLGWDGPLDQYFMQHPDQLFGRPVERAAVDARNPSVLAAHLACAAAEAPLLLDADRQFFGPGMPEVAATLHAASLLGRHPLQPSAPALHYIGAVGSPAAKVSLRAIDPERYAIVDEALGGALLEEIEESKAFFQVYDGAVYMYQGRTYLCKKLDLDKRVAVVRPADLKYYTKCIDFTDIHIRGGRTAFAPAAQATAAAVAAGAAAAAAGAGHLPSSSPRPAAAAAAAAAAGDGPPMATCSPALVTVRWVAFRRIWRGTGQVFDTVDLFLPDVQFETEAAVARLPAAVRERLTAAGLPFRDGVHAACHALLNALPLFLICSPGDMGTECDSPWDSRYRPERLLLYDKHPGGIGLAAAVAPLFPQLARRALQLVRECCCSGRAGCPACVQHPECGEYNAVLHKRAAALVLATLLGEAGERAADAEEDEEDNSAGEEGGPVAEKREERRRRQQQRPQQQQQRQQTQQQRSQQRAAG